MILLNPVVLSVIVMIVLCLLKLNVLLALIVSALVAGLSAGMGLGDLMGTLISGMGGNAETALSYVLLGTLAVAINSTGVATIISKKIASVINGKKNSFITYDCWFSLFFSKLNTCSYSFYTYINSTFIEINEFFKIR